MTASVTPAEESQVQKGVLFCPTCGHEAPLDGDWTVTERNAGDERRTALECPACRHVLVTQPQFRLLA